MPTASNDLNISQAGYVVFDGTAVFTGRTFQAGTGISLTNADGIAGNTTISATGGSSAIDEINVQTGTSPVVPTANAITFNGATVAAGTNPVRTDGTGTSTMALEVQISQAVASTDATKVGLCNFDISRFTVDANGFVSTNGTGIANTITGDTGGQLSPSAANWNIFGGIGIATSGSGNTLTINSVNGGFAWSEVSGVFSSVGNHGYFITNTASTTLPASPSEGTTIKFSVDTTNFLTITANTGQIIRLNATATVSGGTVANVAQGSSIELVYKSTGSVWMAVSTNGNWTLT